MGLIAFGFCLFCFIICIIFTNNKPLHPATLFFGMYSFILFLSLLNMFNIYKPTNEAYFLILLMTASFGIGALTTIFSAVTLHFGNKKKENINQLNIKLFYILVGISIIFLLFDLIIIVKLVYDGVPLWQIRNWTLEEFGSNNPILSKRSFIEELFRTLVLSPVGMLIPPIAAYSFFAPEHNNHKKMILLLSVIRTLLNSMVGGGGRLGFLYFGGCFMVAYLLFSDKKRYQNFKKRKNKRYICIFIIVMIISIILATRMRIGRNYLFQQIYTYFALPPTLLSIWLPEIKNASSTYGILTFYGIVGYFFRALKILGLNFLVPLSYDDAFQHILNAQRFRDVGYGIGNAFVTPVYYLFIDGGKIFVCVVSMFLGAVVSRIHKKLRKKTDIKTFSIYALAMYGVFESFMTIITAVPIHMISFIFIFFMFNKTVKK